MTTYITPYDIATKQALGQSTPVPSGESVAYTADLHSICGGEVITKSKRLVLIKMGGTGLAVSDYVIKA